MKQYSRFLVLVGTMCLALQAASSIGVKVSIANPDDLLLNSFRLTSDDTSGAKLESNPDPIFTGAFGKAVFLDSKSLRFLWRSPFSYTVPDESIGNYVTMTEIDIALALVRSEDGKTLSCYNAVEGVLKWTVDLSATPIVSNVVVYEDGEKMAYAALSDRTLLEVRVRTGARRQGPVLRDLSSKSTLRIKDYIMAEDQNGGVLVISRKNLSLEGALPLTGTPTSGSANSVYNILMPGAVLRFASGPASGISTASISFTGTKGSLKEKPLTFDMEKLSLTVQPLAGKIICPPIECMDNKIAVMTELGDGSQAVTLFTYSPGAADKALVPWHLVAFPASLKIANPALFPRARKETVGDFFIVEATGLWEIDLPASTGENFSTEFAIQIGEKGSNSYKRATIAAIKDSNKQKIIADTEDARFFPFLQVSADAQRVFVGLTLKGMFGQSTVLAVMDDLCEANWGDPEKETIGPPTTTRIFDNGIRFAGTPAVISDKSGNRLVFATSDGRVGTCMVGNEKASGLKILTERLDTPALCVSMTDSGVVLILTSTKLYRTDTKLSSLQEVDTGRSSSDTFLPFMELQGDFVFIVDDRNNIYAAAVSGAFAGQMTSSPLPEKIFSSKVKTTGMVSLNGIKGPLVAASCRDGLATYLLETPKNGSIAFAIVWQWATDVGFLGIARVSATDKSSQIEILITDEPGTTLTCMDPEGLENGNAGISDPLEESPTDNNDIVKRIKLSKASAGMISGNNMFYFVPTKDSLELYTRRDGKRPTGFQGFPLPAPLFAPPLFFSNLSLLVFQDLKGSISFAKVDSSSQDLLNRYYLGRPFRIPPIMLPGLGLMTQIDDGENEIFDVGKGGTR